MTGHILVASTMHAFAARRPETCLSWLETAEQLVRNSPLEVHFFATLEARTAKDRATFDPLLHRLGELHIATGGHRTDWWWFDVDDGRNMVTSANRLHHICAGRNLIQDYALGTGAEWILFLDADMRPPGDAILNLLDLDYPVCGGEVPTYALSGPVRTEPGNRRLTLGGEQYPFPVQEHMNTAGFLMVRRDIFRKVRWRVDPDAGLTDDPCYHEDCTALGYPTYVRKDVVGKHFPVAIPPLEQRGYDLRV